MHKVNEIRVTITITKICNALFKGFIDSLDILYVAMLRNMLKTTSVLINERSLSHLRISYGIMTT